MARPNTNGGPHLRARARGGRCDYLTIFLLPECPVLTGHLDNCAGSANLGWMQIAISMQIFSRRSVRTYPYILHRENPQIDEHTRRSSASSGCRHASYANLSELRTPEISQRGSPPFAPPVAFRSLPPATLAREGVHGRSSHATRRWRDLLVVPKR